MKKFFQALFGPRRPVRPSPRRSVSLGVENLESRFALSPILGTASAATVANPVVMSPVAAQIDVTTAQAVVHVGQNGVAMIQQAVDQVADGGTVYLELQWYRENVKVVGKQVKFIGLDLTGNDGLEASLMKARAGVQCTTIHAADPNVPALTFNVGGGTVERLVLEGGSAGLSSLWPGTPIQLNRVTVQNTGDGISGTFSDLRADWVTIHDVRGDGVKVIRCDSTTLHEVEVKAAGGTGLAIDSRPITVNAGGRVVLQYCTIENCRRGGVRVTGDSQYVQIVDCTVWNNAQVGIRIDGIAYVSLWGTDVGGTTTASTGKRGTGVMLVDCTQAVISDCQFDSNGYAGLAVWGIKQKTHVDVWNLELSYDLKAFEGAGVYEVVQH